MMTLKTQRQSGRSMNSNVNPILARFHTYVESDREIISTVILLPSTDSRRVVSYKQKYVHEILVNCLVKLAQEKVWLNELTVPT